MLGTVQALEVRQRTGFPPEAVDALLARHPFYPYRHWRGFGEGAARKLLRWDLLDRCASDASLCLIATWGLEPLGLAVAELSGWESEQLGVRIVTVRHLIAVGVATQRQQVLEALLRAVKRASGEGVTCFVHRVDSVDYATIAALEAQGFGLVDTSVSFIRGREFRPYLRRVFRRPCPVRPYQGQDWPAIESIASRSHFGGRLYHDPRFPKARVDALYREWVRLCCQRIFADEVIVAIRRGEVGGFLSYQFQRDLYRAAQIRLVGRGLLAVAPEHRGLALELIRGASLTELGADFLQCDIHLENLELMGLYGRTLRMDIAHIHHVFHCWMQPDANGYGGG